MIILASFIITNTFIQLGAAICFIYYFMAI